MDEWMPTISALLQPTSEVKAIVSRLSGLGKLSSYIDFIKQKKWEKQEPQLHAWILYWTTSGDLPPSPLGQGLDVYVEQNQCCYISWDTVAYQKYLLKSHWSRIKQKQLDSAQHATQARKTILILLEFSFLPAETCTRNSIGYVF